ncbi:MAG: EamA family transporter [Eubacteriales bacterium]|nr:EamA family transporter [Eubacteriales bacterium]
MSFYQLFFAAIWANIVLVIEPKQALGFEWQHGVLALIYLAVMSTCLCYFLQTWAQAYLPSSLTAVLLCLEGLFGTFFSLILGYESYRPALLLGALCILVAAAAAARLDAQSSSKLEAM